MGSVAMIYKQSYSRAGLGVQSWKGGGTQRHNTSGKKKKGGKTIPVTGREGP
jgi:hypothetical protein